MDDGLQLLTGTVIAAMRDLNDGLGSANTDLGAHHSAAPARLALLATSSNVQELVEASQTLDHELSNRASSLQELAAALWEAYKVLLADEGTTLVSALPIPAVVARYENMTAAVTPDPAAVAHWRSVLGGLVAQYRTSP